MKFLVLAAPIALGLAACATPPAMQMAESRMTDCSFPVRQQSVDDRYPTSYTNAVGCGQRTSSWGRSDEIKRENHNNIITSATLNRRYPY